MIDPTGNARSITILIPAYGAAEKLKQCLASLVRFAPAGCRIFVLDDATPDESISAACRPVMAGPLQAQYVRSPENRGFVGACNWGAREFWQKDSDLLLLNSDAEITEGSLEEMQRVLRLHEKHAVVTPRSNNATIFSVPAVGPSLPARDSYELWLRIKRDLPCYTVMPTAVGFCLLIKREVFERFGLFDEIYSPGYNEENDFVCRINRYGYSALAANHAFVFHHESSSFGPRRALLEDKNREVLLRRYPEYERKVSDYLKFSLDPVEAFAGLRIHHRPRLLFDLFHLPAAYTGTSEFGLNLLREIGQLVEEEFDLYVGICQPEAFFDNELAGYRIYEDRPDNQSTFDLLFKPCQVFSWHEFQRMNRLAPRISWVLQDIIAVRCEYLNSPGRQALFQKAVELSDCVFTISEFSRSDYAAFYGTNSPMRVIYHGTNERLGNGLPATGEYVLLMGNHFTHKGVADALEHLGNGYPVVVVGGAEMSDCKPNVRWLKSGQISHLEMREAVAGARLLVYPSYYEGFGLPVVDALAIGKPVITLASELNKEIGALVNDPNFHMVESLRDLDSAVSRFWNLVPAAQAVVRLPSRTWRETAREYVGVFRELMTTDVSTAGLRARSDCLRLLTLP